MFSGDFEYFMTIGYIFGLVEICSLLVHFSIWYIVQEQSGNLVQKHMVIIDGHGKPE
jgi:hypothetical protein